MRAGRNSFGPTYGSGFLIRRSLKLSHEPSVLHVGRHCCFRQASWRQYSDLLEQTLVARPMYSITDRDRAPPSPSSENQPTSWRT